MEQNKRGEKFIQAPSLSPHQKMANTSTILYEHNDHHASCVCTKPYHHNTRGECTCTQRCRALWCSCQYCEPCQNCDGQVCRHGECFCSCSTCGKDDDNDHDNDHDHDQNHDHDLDHDDGAYSTQTGGYNDGAYRRPHNTNGGYNDHDHDHDHEHDDGGYKSFRDDKNVEEYLDGYRRGFYDAYKKFATADCQGDCKPNIKRLLKSYLTTIKQQPDDGDDNTDFSDN